MVRLAGEVADGVGIGIMSSVEFVRDIVRPNARQGAEQAGRDPDALVFPTAATISINQDAHAARQASKRAICKLYHPIPHPYYDSQLRQLGFAEFADQATQLVPAGRLAEAIDLVPEAVVELRPSPAMPNNVLSVFVNMKVVDEPPPELAARRYSLADYADLFQLMRLQAANLRARRLGSQGR